MGRRNLAAWHIEPRSPMDRDELQSKIWPPMHTRDGRPVRGGPQTMAGGADTYIAYGRGWANVSNTPFREYKHWVHEGGISTPLIAHWPARIRGAGELARQPAHLIDLMATCVDAAGADYPAQYAGYAIQPMEGVSLVPVFAGQPLHRAQPLFWEHEGNRAVRDGRWKLVAKGPNGPWELYDMESDRTEMHDLAAAQPERAANLAKDWEAWAERASAKPWPWDRPEKAR
jgi:arylsulfatase